jgi:hypothetical protein
MYPAQPAFSVSTYPQCASIRSDFRTSVSRIRRLVISNCRRMFGTITAFGNTRLFGGARSRARERIRRTYHIGSTIQVLVAVEPAVIA